MKAQKIWRRLDDALYTGKFVTVRRKRISEFTSRGFIVGVSDSWAMLHRLDPDLLTTNGYYALRVDDITSIQPGVSFVPRYLERRGVRGIAQPDILLDDLPGILSSTRALFPLVSVSVEPRSRNALYGRVLKVGPRLVTLDDVSHNAAFHDHPYSMPWKKITRVGFGSAYANALWQTTQEEAADSR